MPLSRRQFIKQFGVAGVVTLAALSLRPEKALAGVSDNLTPNELEEIRKIAVQNKDDIGELTARLGGLRLFPCTQDAYDNMGTHDPSTLYLIKSEDANTESPEV